MELNHYKCVKDVHATPMTRGVYNAYRGWAMPAGEVAEDPGYLVVYNKETPDQYESWSPKRIFDAGYIELPGSGLPEYQRRVIAAIPMRCGPILDSSHSFYASTQLAALPPILTSANQ